MTTVAPYGHWRSPLTPSAMVQGVRRYGFARLGPSGGVTWCEQRPDEGGRTVLRQRGRDGETRSVTPDGFNARTRVHEYGGLPYGVDGDTVWAARFSDQRLVHLVEGDARVVSTGDGWRFAEPSRDPLRARVIAVGERHTPGVKHPENGLVAVDIATGDVSWLLRGHDFVAAPRLSPDGRRLAFLAWEHPHMAWDAAALYVAAVRDDGALDAPVHVAGDATASVNDVLWRDDDTLLFSYESDGRWQPHAWNGRAVTQIATLPGEVGGPLWQVGTRAMALTSPDELVCTSWRAGRSALMAVDLRRGAVTVLREDLPHVGDLDARDGVVVMVLGSNAVLRLDRATGALDVIAGARPEGNAPEAVTFSTDGGAVAHGFFHAPDNPAFTGVPGTLPPLVVTAHGGPTAAASPLPSPAIRFWTTRGFAVLDVNYRGSTGFGRAFRDALRGRWGVDDVTDCVRGAAHLVAQGRVRGDALFIHGASAGGYTVLQALCDHDVFRAGACHFGISDPRSLMAETHKLESRYDDFLFGTGDVREAALCERTPLDHPERISAPVIFFQGLEDLAVPPAQTARIHASLQARGLASEYRAYEGEQHGFRRADTLEDVWTRELAFFLRAMALPA